MQLHIVLAGTLALAAAGCQQRPDMTAVNDNISDACAAATLGYALFEATAADKVKESTLTKVRAGYAAVSAVCANPPKNSVDAMVAAVTAVQAFKQEINAVKKR